MCVSQEWETWWTCRRWCCFLTFPSTVWCMFWALEETHLLSNKLVNTQLIEIKSLCTYKKIGPFFFFYFLLPMCGRESIVLGVKSLKLNFCIFYKLWGFLNSKIMFLEVGLSLCVSVYVCVCDCSQYNSKTNHSRETKSGIQNWHHMGTVSGTFGKDWTWTLRTGQGALKGIQIHCDLWVKFLMRFIYC